MSNHTMTIIRYVLKSPCWNNEEFPEIQFQPLFEQQNISQRGWDLSIKHTYANVKDGEISDDSSIEAAEVASILDHLGWTESIRLWACSKKS